MVYFIYAIPLIVVMITSWLFQSFSHRTLMKMQKIDMKVTAVSVAQKLFEQEKVKTTAERGTDYTQNTYDEENDKILLSPDIYEESDAMSVGLAVLTAGTAVISKQIPEKAAALKKIKSYILIVFWLLFTVLAFGLMGKHLPTVIIGYGILVLMIILYIAELKIKKNINKEILSRIAQLKIFDSEKESLIKKVIRAESSRL